MKVTIPSTVLSTELQDEGVLLNLETGEYFGLDGVGMAMWKALGSGRSLEAIRADLLAEYDVDAATLAKDLEELIAKLVERKLVVVSEDGA